MDMNEDSLMDQELVGRQQWTSQMTKLLIQEVMDNLSLINNKNYMQKKIWRQIAYNFNRRGYNVTEEQCCTKWKNLKQKYKSVRDKKNETGQAAESWEYFDSIDSFLNTRPEVAPASIASSTHGFRIRQPSPEILEECNNENDPVLANTSYGVKRKIKKRRNSTEFWMEKLYEQRKHQHKRNMRNQEKFLDLFEKYIQKPNT